MKVVYVSVAVSPHSDAHARPQLAADQTNMAENANERNDVWILNRVNESYSSAFVVDRCLRQVCGKFAAFDTTGIKPLLSLYCFVDLN